MLKNLQAIILAAGRSSRFNTKQSKLVEKVCGQEMVIYTTKLLESFNIPTTVVVGYQKEAVEKLINSYHPNVNFVHQKEQLGTGHAVMCTKDYWTQENLLILNGDVPLISQELITDLYAKHIEQNATITFVTAYNIDPSINAYGRVVKTDNQIEIIEAKDDTHDRKDTYCINAGIYLINRSFLQNAINELQKSKVTGELYITDLIHNASQKGLVVETLNVPFDSIRGINTLEELWVAEQIKKAELIKNFMKLGIRFQAPQTNNIDVNVCIGSGSFVGSGVHIYGNTQIGQNVKIEPYSILENVILEDNVTVNSHTIIKNSCIKSNAQVGPFAHVADNCTISSQTTVGNFVEIKRSFLGNNTKAKHLSYIADAQIGENVNIGAGTITCNYNGITKEKTIIEDNVCIGSNNSLVAPIIIGKDSFTAAGSVLTKNVPANALAIARAYQTNKEDYAKKLKEPSFFAAKKSEKQIAN